LAKIAALLNDVRKERALLGTAPGLRVALLAAADGWAVEDVLCTYRPGDASFEERHDRYRVALVGAGTFQCRAAGGRELLTPGSLLLGNAHECFECGHEHGTGDRCLAFAYSSEAFERLAFDTGVRSRPHFRALRLPPLSALAPLVAETCAVWAEPPNRIESTQWEELGIRIAAAATRCAADPSRSPRSPVNAEGGIARVVRLIESDTRAPLTLQALAGEANLSRFHFVRAFARVTGLTPHRYITRARLRKAAVRLASSEERVIDIAMMSGYSDVSNFNHAFRAEFGTAPLEHRAQLRRRH
jgi:AraC family transcriptional regulator